MDTLQGIVAWFTDPANWQGPNGIPVRLAQHLLIAGKALIIAFLLALPLGVVLGHLGRGGVLAVNLGNVGRAIPVLGILIMLASWAPVGIGDTAAVLALALFAIPPLLTNAYVAIRGVDPATVDGARGMGMTGWQVLRRVELPLAVVLLFAGVRTAVVQVLATTTLAALVGGGGLGRYIVDGFARQDTVLLLSGAILVAVLCMGTEVALAVTQRRITPRGMRRSRRSVEVVDAEIPAAL